MKQQAEIEIQAEAPRTELGVCLDALSEQQNHNDRLSCLILKAAALWISRQCVLTSTACEEKIAAPESPSTASLSSKSATTILVSLANLGPAQPSQIASSTGLSQPTVQRTLKKLLATNLVVKSGRTRGVRYALLKHKKCYE
ncbi:MAG: MarR family transcriptional regulator [Opitutaceae bacterium]